MRTTVLIHGHHLGTPDWDRIEWGNPMQGEYGNIPKGLVEALYFDAGTIVFGTGASQKDGLTEGEYALKVAKERIHQLPQFASMGVEDGTRWIDARAVIEKTATNTRTEIIAGARIAKDRGAERLIQIACRTHSARAHNTALSVLRADPDLKFLLSHFYTVASDTHYDGADAQDVVIIEPPHHPDGPSVSFNTTLQEVVAHMSDARASELNERLARTIADYEKYL